MLPSLMNAQPLYDHLQSLQRHDWAAALRQQTADAIAPGRNGHLPLWTDTWGRLPDCPDARIRTVADAVAVTGTLSGADDMALPSLLKTLHPWRKGPFRFFSTHIDTEWRSNLKWDRLAGNIDFRGCRVVDVGCGNGYYGWRMLEAGASFVLRLDPFLLYVMQFEFLRRYAPDNTPHFLLPLADDALTNAPALFDIAVSMGVLYHRASPIEHLQLLWNTLRPGGRLVLETLVVEGGPETVLVPPGRYAKMRNVWFIPSVDLLIRWLQRIGFRRPELLDVSITTTHEQRSTDWMTFESLPDFLDPADPARTIEGCPAPRRALLTAIR